jgi:hypothetical protein
MWQVTGALIPPHWLLPIPIRTLYEFDGPRIFLCKDVPGNLYLAYQCGEDREVMRFLVVPCTVDLERRLTAGETDVRDALTRPRGWLFDFGKDWSALRCWKVNIDDLPPRTLPEPGVMLWAHLQPVMNVMMVRPCSAETVIAPAAFSDRLACEVAGAR